jgi:hypothetical protein
MSVSQRRAEPACPARAPWAAAPRRARQSPAERAPSRCVCRASAQPSKRVSKLQQPGTCARSLFRRGHGPRRGPRAAKAPAAVHPAAVPRLKSAPAARAHAAQRLFQARTHSTSEGPRAVDVDNGLACKARACDEGRSSRHRRAAQPTAHAGRERAAAAGRERGVRRGLRELRGRGRSAGRLWDALAGVSRGREGGARVPDWAPSVVLPRERVPSAPRARVDSNGWPLAVAL